MHYQSFVILLFALVTLLLQGCTSASKVEEEISIPLQEGNHPIVLCTHTNSRADNLLQDFGVTHFEVAAWKENTDGTTECVMGSDQDAKDPYAVEYKDGEWVYEGIKEGQYLKYWDLSAKKYLFQAYFIKSDMANPPITAVLKNGQLSVTNLQGNTSSTDNSVYECSYCRDNQGSFPVDYDLLTSDTETFYTPVAATQRPAMADIVPLRFHSLMSKVIFKIYATGNIAGKDLTVSKFTAIASGNTHAFVTQSDYTSPNTYNPNAYDNPLSVTIFDGNPGVKAGTSSSTATTLSETYQLPQNINDSTAEITVVLGGKTYNTTINLFQNSINNRWDKDTVYTYILVLSMDEDVILVNVQLSPWIVGGETQTTEDNW